MKILVIGSSGMVGHMLTLRLLETGYDVTDIARSHKLRKETLLIDINDLESIKDVVMNGEYNYIFNCIAVLVKQSETERLNAVYVNSYFPQLLVSWCSNMESKVIHLSSGGVFGGKEEFYLENSSLSPQNFYATTKAAGEFNNNKDLVIRSDFWGADIKKKGQAIFNWFVQENGNVRAFDNIYFNGVSNYEFVNFVLTLFNRSVSGLIHLGAEKAISKGNMLRLIKEKLNLQNINLIAADNTKSTVLLKNNNYIGYKVNSYEKMIDDLQKWIRDHKTFYEHYNFI